MAQTVQRLTTYSRHEEAFEQSIMILDKRDYTSDMPVFVKEAVRAVILRDGRLAVQQSSRGDCKLLGGGVDAGENFTEALCREVEEEAGLVVKRGTIQGIGRIEEIHRDIFLPEQIYHCFSYYFSCEAEEKQIEPHMTQSELAKGYHLEWVTPEEFVSANAAYMTDGWIERDTRFVKQWLI
ncbi:MAG: NUDIX domain-containing protein [Lachnospiraceae bacterium]|nr:NUDIX domain-containing protein [Lachnospiraceae bacterium]